MTEAHNLNYYQNFYSQIKNFQTSLENKDQAIPFFSSIYFAIDFVSQTLTNQITYPLIRGSFSLASRGVVKTTALFSSPLAEFFEETLRDPFSTKTLLRWGKRVEWVAKKGAKQEPVTLPLIRDLHIYGIMFSRYLYIFTKDINTFLNIPQTVHSYMDWSRIEEELGVPPTTCLGKGWREVKILTQKAADGLVDLAARVLKVGKRYLPLTSALLCMLQQGILSTRHYIHQKVIQKAHRVIDTNEKKIREKVIANVAEMTIRATLKGTFSTVLRGAFFYGIYCGVRGISMQVVGNQELSDNTALVASYGLKVLGAVLWVRFMRPTFQNLKKDYTQEFDTEASTLKELAFSINRQNLSRVISLVQAIT